uniref:Transposase Tc1-like domain-containing protein n=1 Tax=Electrophorus electricus TaxID=8005 RepID=A0A4W4GZC9_ELEEL
MYLHCTEGERTLIKKLIGEGKTYKEGQKIIGCSAKMISNALKWQTKPKTRGRKRNTTIRVDHRITRMAKKHPMISSREIKEELQLPVSTATIRRCLREAKLFARNPHKVPLLKKKDVFKRLCLSKNTVTGIKWHNLTVPAKRVQDITEVGESSVSEESDPIDEPPESIQELTELACLKH